MSSSQHSLTRPRIPFFIAGVVTGVLALTLLVSGGALLVADVKKDGNGSEARRSPGVNADVKAGAQLPALEPIAWATLGIGVFFALITAGLAALAIRPRQTHTDTGATVLQHA